MPVHLFVCESVCTIPPPLVRCKQKTNHSTENKIELIINFMKKALISPIPKKISQFHLKHKRGIFIVNSVRSILIKLIYNSKYLVIDQNMSESNIGSRKYRCCIDHNYVNNSIIHEQLKSVHNNPLKFRFVFFNKYLMV